MSTETTDESKYMSVPGKGMVEISCSFLDTIKPSDEFVQVFKITYILARDKNKNNTKQIKTIEIKMKKLFHKVINSQDTKLDDVITLAYTYQQVCYAYLMFHREKNLSVAKESILRCLHLIKDIKLSPKIIILTLRAYSQLGSIYQLQQKPENALEMLNKAVDLYLLYIEEHSEYDIPIDYEDIIMELPSTNSYIKLRSIYMFVLRRSIAVHAEMESKPNEKLMRSYHLLLTDEINYLQTTKLYKQWFEKAKRAYDYLIICNRFPEANNYINTMMFVKRTYLYAEYMDSMEKKLPSEELYEQDSATLQLITLCLARYGVALLRHSVERLLRLEKDEDSKANNSTTKYSSKSKDRRLFLFAVNNEVYLDSSTYCNITPFTYILNYDKAQRFFYSILNTNSKLVSNLVNVKLYILLTLHTSNMYKYVAFYEKDTGRRFLLRKRHAEILEEAENMLSYQDGNELLKLLWLQLTIAYSTLIDMKLEDIEAAPPSYMSQKHDTLVDEINALVAKGLSLLRDYIYYR
ncbi:KIF-binding protein-like isoform X2 [Odontomachus brunneus]|uniref:KIF-binding protein-like isoform X2 n=1 Tax=Odontomachus brunneus TaxID=486640 RepID=UPI0013F2285E|nr:KIF-binding protein-like isoform X2 [Odontomachus brunneus]